MARACVLAGGLGTRLAPYTTVLPKPLMPVGRRSVLERLVSDLAACGLPHITISLGYLGHLVEAVVGDGGHLGAQVTYTRERVPLGTAGALALLDVEPDEEILVVNGDTLTDLDFSVPVAELNRREADALIVCVRRTVGIDFGVVQTDVDGWMSSYQEKPQAEYLISTGINVLKGSSILGMPPGRLDMPDLMSRIMNHSGRVACLTVDSHWWDLGRPDDLLAANEREASDLG